MPGHNSLAQGFERRFLFGYGRHFWNLIGIVGFSMMATGGIYLIDAQFKAKQYPLPKDFSRWMCSDQYHQYFVDNKIGHLDKSVNQNYQFVTGIPNSKVECYIYDEWDRTHYRGKKRPYSEEGLVYNYNLDSKYVTYPGWEEKDGYMVVPTRHIKNIFDRGFDLFKKLEKQNQQAETNNALKTTRAVASPFLASSGLGLVAFSSLMSAILSIERNTRND